MESQTLTQTVNVQVGGTTGSLANTGTSIMLITVIGLGLIIASLLIWYFGVRRANRKLSFNGLGVFIFMAFAVAGLTSNLSNVSAAPTLTLAANQNTINLSVPQGGGKANTTTTLTSGTTNPSGYELTADLAQPEPGISLSLSGGSIATSTPLNVGDVPLTLKTTSSSTTNDTTDVTLSFTVDSSVKSGTKELKLAYKVADNAASAPVTMQDLTSGYCQSSMQTYNGTNEEAVVTLNDPRGDGQTYRVAKLADGKCWMLDNLKLGSTAGAVALTSADSNVGANFSLPQLYSGSDTSYLSEDAPFAYGPVPGDTGSGATSYGYLYNWSAATAGETTTSHTETAGNAPYSICPANWRLPIGGEYESGDGEFAALDIAFGGNGMGVYSGEPNIAKWQHDGPFKGTFAGGWSEGFDGQGDYGGLWSSSAYPGGAGVALGAGFNADGVNPGGGDDRDYGVAVRCLLN